jgi:hypothetical protein
MIADISFGSPSFRTHKIINESEAKTKGGGKASLKRGSGDFRCLLWGSNPGEWGIDPGIDE